jgi:hypothetical protein
VSRLIDRIIAYGCGTLTVGDLFDMDHGHIDPDAEARQTVEAMRSMNPALATVDDQRLLAAARDEHKRLRAMKGAPGFDGRALSDVPAVVADEVGRYIHDLPAGTDMADLVLAVVPPLPTLFVEFQHVPARHLGIATWGVLLKLLPGPNDDVHPDMTRTRNTGDSIQEIVGDFRWLVSADLVIEHDKYKPIGPVGQWLIPLDYTGCLITNPDDHKPAIFGSLSLGEISASVDTPEDRASFHALFDGLSPQLFAALFAVSLMHCKNIIVETHEPPPGLDRKWRKRTGRPLVRFQTLDLTPTRRLLNETGDAERQGLGQALHICRGHFKTFTADAPLFGRHTGTYWWSPHARGHAADGAVISDYRVRIPANKE